MEQGFARNCQSPNHLPSILSTTKIKLINYFYSDLKKNGCVNSVNYFFKFKAAMFNETFLSFVHHHCVKFVQMISVLETTQPIKEQLKMYIFSNYSRLGMPIFLQARDKLQWYTSYKGVNQLRNQPLQLASAYSKFQHKCQGKLLYCQFALAKF